LVKQIARQADAVTVRDENSAKLLKQIGVGGVITDVADPAFALEPAPPVGVALPNDAVLLSLRHWKTDDLSRALKRTEQDSPLNLQTLWQGSPIALPMHLPEDAAYMKNMLGWTAQYDWQASGATVEQTLGRFQGANLVVAMRLHALIFAARCGVPFVALSYDPKVNALAQAAGQADALLPVENITVSALQESLQRVRETRHDRQTHLQAWSEEQRKRALVPAQIAGQWFAG
jgi:polysaccharide pyruvyl transferase WcaK-like protein